MKNEDMLYNILLHLKDLPYFVLSPREQWRTIGFLRKLFLRIKKQLDLAQLDRSSSCRFVQEVLKLTDQVPVNEYRVLSAVKSLIFELRRLSKPLKGEEKILLLLDCALNRAKPFWLSEEVFSKNLEDSKVNLKERSKQIIQKEMQLYALDYFMTVYKGISDSGNADIYSSNGNLPSLYEDAVSDDMLNKVVYLIPEKKLRYRMVGDYYNYKKVFLDLKPGDKLAPEKEKCVVSALKQYILSLLQVSLDYDARVFCFGIIFPYGKDVQLEELRKRI